MANSLLQELAVATGLPENLIHDELKDLVSAAGISEKDLDLDHLREILASYAQDVLLSAKLSHDEEVG